MNRKRQYIGWIRTALLHRSERVRKRAKGRILRRGRVIFNKRKGRALATRSGRSPYADLPPCGIGLVNGTSPAWLVAYYKANPGEL